MAGVPLKTLMVHSERLRLPSKDDPAKNCGDEDESSKKGSQSQPILNVGEWITKAEAARIRGVTRQAIAKLVSKGKFATLKIAGHTLLKKSDVESYKPEPGGRPARP